MTTVGVKGLKVIVKLKGEGKRLYTAT